MGIRAGMSATFAVQAAQGRRHTARVARNETIGAVLQQACTKFRLDPAEWALQHGRKILDDSLVVRLANLANNAKLELVARPRGAGASASRDENVTVALQLPEGVRVKRQFPSSAALWDVLCAVEAEAAAG